jgi:archaellum component FlaC
MTYPKLFTKILLEGAELPLAQNNGTYNQDDGTHNIPDNASAGMFDDDFDPESLETAGIQQEIGQIEAKFDEKMALLDNIDSLDPNKIESRLDQLQKYVNKINAYLETKEVDMTNSYSIMANLINKDPQKLQEFNNVTSAIDDYREDVRSSRETVEMAAKKLHDTIGKLAKLRNK